MSSSRLNLTLATGPGNRRNPCEFTLRSRRGNAARVALPVVIPVEARMRYTGTATRLDLSCQAGNGPTTAENAPVAFVVCT